MMYALSAASRLARSGVITAGLFEGTGPAVIFSIRLLKYIMLSEIGGNNRSVVRRNMSCGYFLNQTAEIYHACLKPGKLTYHWPFEGCIVCNKHDQAVLRRSPELRMLPADEEEEEVHGEEEVLGEEQMQEQEDARGLVPEERPLVFTFLENKSRITANESRLVSPEAGNETILPGFRTFTEQVNTASTGDFAEDDSLLAGGPSSKQHVLRLFSQHSCSG
jgi:hypothetical protein